MEEQFELRKEEMHYFHVLLVLFLVVGFLLGIIVSCGITSFAKQAVKKEDPEIISDTTEPVGRVVYITKNDDYYHRSPTCPSLNSSQLAAKRLCTKCCDDLPRNPFKPKLG